MAAALGSVHVTQLASLLGRFYPAGRVEIAAPLPPFFVLAHCAIFSWMNAGSTSPPHKKDWVLNQEAFEKLLQYLDADRRRAGEKYENIRRKLVSFFGWRGCPAPDEYADRTIDRVARRIAGGVELGGKEPVVYFYGVALNVLREHWRSPERRVEAVEALPLSSHFPITPKTDTAELERAKRDQQLRCLERCLRSLPPESRELVIQYHRKEKRAKIEGRKEIAERLKIPLNALRIRVYRIRLELQSCVHLCVQSSGST